MAWLRGAPPLSVSWGLRAEGSFGLACVRGGQTRNDSRRGRLMFRGRGAWGVGAEQSALPDVLDGCTTPLTRTPAPTIGPTEGTFLGWTSGALNPWAQGQ